MTQAELADGYFSRSYVSGIERNERKPSAEALKLIAERLGKPLSFFMPDTQEQLETRIRALLGQASGLIAVDQLDDAQQVLRTVESMVFEVSLKLRGSYFRLASWAEVKSKHYLSAVRLALQAEECFREDDDRISQWYCLHAAAQGLYEAGQIEWSLEFALKALSKIASTGEHLEEQRLTLYLLGVVHYAKGRRQEAEGYFTEAADLGSQVDLDTTLRAVIAKSACAMDRSDWEGAMEWAQRAERLAQSKAEEQFWVVSTMAQCECHLRAGRQVEALAVFAQLESKQVMQQDLRRYAYREFLMALVDTGCPDLGLVLRVESVLSNLLGEEGENEAWMMVKDRWAVEKSKLSRTGANIGVRCGHYSDRFTALGYTKEAAEVMFFGADLLTRRGLHEEAAELFREAYVLVRG